MSTKNNSVHNCPFCKIAKRKDSNALILWENKDVICFLPQEMEVFGHVLIIPKFHFKDIFDISTSDLKKFIAGVHFMAKRLKNILKADGVNILNASGKEAQQSIGHLHFHIMPRFQNDKLDLWPKIKKKNFNKTEVFRMIKNGL